VLQRRRFRHPQNLRERRRTRQGRSNRHGLWPQHPLVRRRWTGTHRAQGAAALQHGSSQPPVAAAAARSAAPGDRPGSGQGRL
ncbi:MAG: hypothetical protein AVDCRST_MAG62-1574, partial [uncultured Sphingomonas sp.]